MRVVPFAINTTDAVHVYSDSNRIWLQLRRDVPTLQDIGKPSFKSALNLTPVQAIALAGELLTAATQHQNGPVPPKPTSATKPAKQLPPKPNPPPTPAAKRPQITDLVFYPNMA